MFRLKLTLLYFFTIVFVAAVMWVYIDSEEDKYISEQIYPSLHASAKSYSYLTADRVGHLEAYAGSLLASDLPVYMELLNEEREALREMAIKIRQTFPNRSRVAPERILSFVEEEGKAQLDAFEDKVRARVKTRIKIESGYSRYMRDILASCMAEEDSFGVCYFKLTYVPLTRIIFPVQKKELGGLFPELFILVDQDKTARLVFDNLDSSVDDLRKEDLYNAGIRYKNHIIENFDQSAEVLKQIDSSFDRMISSSFVLNDRIVFVTVATRVEDSKGNFIGALIVGYELDNTRAREDTSAVLGLRPTLEKCLRTSSSDSTESMANEALCEYEMSRQVKGITYFAQNKKGQLLRAGTTIGDQQANALSQAVRKSNGRMALLSDFPIALVVPFNLDYIHEAESLMAVLTVNVDAAMSMHTTLKVILVLASALIFMIGAALIHILLRSFIKPFEAIEAGIHEVIGGNFEYTFPFTHREELPRSMAQSLTIMKAVLLGQPLPEDVEAAANWGVDIRGDSEELLAEVAQPAESASGASAIETIAAAEVKESVTDYYRRLFKEYCDARQANGEDVSAITYVKFVEKLARTEKSLRDKYSCKQIRFRVEKKDKQIVLVPIKVLD
jgi:hypothetical protein